MKAHSSLISRAGKPYAHIYDYAPVLLLLLTGEHNYMPRFPLAHSVPCSLATSGKLWPQNLNLHMHKGSKIKLC